MTLNEKAIAWLTRYGQNCHEDSSDGTVYVYLESFDDMNISVQITSAEVEYRAELWDELHEEELP